MVGGVHPGFKVHVSEDFYISQHARWLNGETVAGLGEITTVEIMFVQCIFVMCSCNSLKEIYGLILDCHCV